MKTLLFCFCFGLVASGHARFVRLIVNTNPQYGQIVASNRIEIAAHEVATLINHYGTQYVIDYRIEGLNRTIPLVTASGNTGPQTVVGPAVILLQVSGTSAEYAFCTLQIIPESFPPDKTIIIPEGTGARIALECSTNLTQWTEVYSETHTNSPSNKFFRIKAERIP